MLPITAIENFLSKEYQDHLEQLVTRAELPLYYNTDSMVGGLGNAKPNINTKEIMQLTHAFVRNGEVTSNHWNVFSGIVFGFMAKAGITDGMQLVRAKLNLNPPALDFKDSEYFTPHIDTVEQGITAIYYVNDCDGDTLFFNNEGDIVQRVSPKKGTLVYFDSSIYHAGTPTKKGLFRSVVNFNWVQK